MATRATATFNVENWDENATLETDDGSKVTHARVSMSFEGDLEGEGTVEWLMGYADDGTAGTWAWNASSEGSATSPGASSSSTPGRSTARQPSQLLVVPGSGTGELTGLTGEGTFEAGMGSEGRRSVTLDYEV